MTSGEAIRKRASLLLLILLVHAAGFAQFFTTGTDPGSIRWRQIKTEKYRLIFPSSFSPDAQYLANIMDFAVKYESLTLTSKVPRMPVIIHQQSAISNGLTVWAPKRIEMYPCPPQNSYAEEWIEQLAIHEYRHAVQISKMNQGFSKALYCLFGEQATGAVLGLYVPSWFLEGDAVCTETALSRAGRGRMPSFENILRAQLLEKGIYRYDKATMGSYRTFIPDPYILGYHLVAWGRMQYGPVLWNTALNRSAQLPFMVVPFSSGIHKVTGNTKTKFYNTALMDLSERWAEQDVKVSLTPAMMVTKRNPKSHTDYNFPVLNDTTSVIALKSDMDNPDRIVHLELPTGEEEVILTPGNIIKDNLSVSGTTLTWSEYLPDPRWENRNFATIRTYDMKTRKSRYLAKRDRYFFPVLSPDSKKIAAVHIDLENNCSLDLLNSSTGEVLKRYPFPDKELVTEPTWSPEGDEILFCTLTDKGKALAEIKLETDSLVVLIRPNFYQISGPVYLSEDSIFFTAGASGIDNLYYFDETTREVFQVNSSRFGAYNAYLSPSRRTLFWSSITSDGLMLMENAVTPQEWLRLDHVSDQSIKLYQDLVSQEHCNIQDSVIRYNLDRLRFSAPPETLPDTAGAKAYPEKRYSKWGHLFNVHSWAPASIDATNLNVQPGVSVLSQNVLSSMTAGAGYRYNYNDQTGTYYAQLTYSGLYPVISASYEYGTFAGYYHTQGSQVRYTWNESTFDLGLSIPWNFSRRKYYRYLVPALSTGVTSYLHNKSTPEAFPRGYTWDMSYSIYAANYLYSTQKDMFPRLGQSVYAVYKNSPFGGIDMGSILACSANLYFPGIFKHQGIWLYGGGQQRFQKEGVFNLFSNVISLPRGTQGFDEDKMFSLSANYKLPLFYPDWSLGSVMYIKRFKLNLFFDFAEGASPGVTTVTKSTGAELTADLHILRFQIPFELGVRSIFLPDSNSWAFEFLYAVSL
jgi:hypothetical protein